MQNLRRLKMLSTTRKFFSLQGRKVPKNSFERFSSSLAEFKNFWPDIRQDFLEAVQKNDHQNIATKSFCSALEYRHNKAKHFRGELTLEAYKSFSKDLRKEKIRQACILGWCVEACMTSAIILDDVQDKASMRYGEPTWHKKTSISTASNHGIMLLAVVQNVLKKNFENEPFYNKICETLNNSNLLTEIGQSLDIEASNINILHFTMNFYDRITLNKATIFTCHAPIGLAWHFAGKNDPHLWKATEKILVNIGKFFQAKNDFKDVFVSAKEIGRIGQDIQDNKCTWLAVTAVQRASVEQKEVLKHCYGSRETEKVQKVKMIYDELELAKVFEYYERQFKDETNILLKSLPDDISSILSNLINKISQG